MLRLSWSLIDKGPVELQYGGGVGHTHGSVVEPIHPGGNWQFSCPPGPVKQSLLPAHEFRAKAGRRVQM